MHNLYNLGNLGTQRRNQKTKTMKYLTAILLGCVLAILFSRFDSCHQPKSYPPNCEYRLPPQYSIISTDGGYAIKFMHINEYEHWFWVDAFGDGTPDFVSNMGERKDALIFDDSCLAKGALKHFCEQNPKECIFSAIEQSRN